MTDDDPKTAYVKERQYEFLRMLFEMATFVQAIKILLRAMAYVKRYMVSSSTPLLGMSIFSSWRNCFGESLGWQPDPSNCSVVNGRVEFISSPWGCGKITAPGWGRHPSRGRKMKCEASVSWPGGTAPFGINSTPVYMRSGDDGFGERNLETLLTPLSNPCWLTSYLPSPIWHNAISFLNALQIHCIV